MKRLSYLDYKRRLFKLSQDYIKRLDSRETMTRRSSINIFYICSACTTKLEYYFLLKKKLRIDGNPFNYIL